MNTQDWIRRYLDRIGVGEPVPPTRETLFRLHRAHLFAVPFENLDIHVPRPIVLRPESLREKIIERRRGGFCFEQNGLFHDVLSGLGFKVRRVEANVYSAERNNFGIPMNHMALIVGLDEGEVLADVGFGASFIDPLPLESTEVQTQDAGFFRLEVVDRASTHMDDAAAGEKAAHTLFHCRELGAPEMHIAYRFFDRGHELSDYDAACHYMQTSPETHFTQKRLCSQWTPKGRSTLTDRKWIQTDWTGKRVEVDIQDDSEFEERLESEFGIRL